MGRGGATENGLEDGPLVFRDLIPLACQPFGVRGTYVVEGSAYEKRVLELR